MSALAVLHASQLVTLAGPKRPRVGREMSELAILPDGGMLIRDGKIDSVGTINQIKNSVADAEIVDAGGRVVLPGFVDAHTHLVFAGNRLDDFERRARGETYQQIARAGGGIWSTVEKTRAAGNAELLAQAKLAEFCGVFCERGYFEIEQSRKILSAAKRLGLKLRGHVDQLSNCGGAKLMAELGATTADHLEKTDEVGIVALKSAKVQPV